MSSTRIEEARTLLAALIVAAAALSLTACEEDLEGCERCDFTFYWDSEGALSSSEESCRPVDCGGAICGLCYDTTYNAANLPMTSTCDSCAEDPECSGRLEYCPTHPDECDPEADEPCGCTDTYTDDLHCGACFAACPEGERCIRGECSEG